MQREKNGVGGKEAKKILSVEKKEERPRRAITVSPGLQGGDDLRKTDHVRDGTS
jgi:hypothetical protein